MRTPGQKCPKCWPLACSS